MKHTKTRPTAHLVFAPVLALTLVSVVVMLHLASQPTLTEQQNRVFDIAIALCTTGFTACVGLLGTGKPHE